MWRNLSRSASGGVPARSAGRAPAAAAGWAGHVVHAVHAASMTCLALVSSVQPYGHLDRPRCVRGVTWGSMAMRWTATILAGWLALIGLVSSPGASPTTGSPALWRVTLDDHQLVVLGSLVPLPVDVQWNQAPIRRHLGEATALLEPPGVDLRGGASWLGTLWRLPTLLRVRNNPGEMTLDEVLPASLRERWERQRAIHLTGDRSVQRRRPMVAADVLQKRAMAEFGLALDNQVAERVSQLARRQGVRRIDTALPLQLDAVNAFLDALARDPLDDQACFERILARVEAGPGNLHAQALAWRSGSLAVLRSQPLGDTFAVCIQALLAHPAAQVHGLHDLSERARAHWLQIAEQTLRAHRRSVAVLPLTLVLGESGYLAELERRGFRVEPSVLGDDAFAGEARVSQR